MMTLLAKLLSMSLALSLAIALSLRQWLAVMRRPNAVFGCHAEFLLRLADRRRKREVVESKASYLRGEGVASNERVSDVDETRLPHGTGICSEEL